MLYEDGDTDNGNDSELEEIAAADPAELVRQEREEAERIEREAAEQREAHENTIKYDEERAEVAQDTQAATDPGGRFAGIEGLGEVIDNLAAVAMNASVQNHEKGPVKSGMSKAEANSKERQGQDAESDGGREG